MEIHQIASTTRVRSLPRDSGAKNVVQTDRSHQAAVDSQGRPGAEGRQQLRGDHRSCAAGENGTKLLGDCHPGLPVLNAEELDSVGCLDPENAQQSQTPTIITRLTTIVFFDSSRAKAGKA